jgi:lambda family phage portal protein
MNPLDKIIEIFSPSWASKRQLARLSMDHARKYDGAAYSRRTSGWYSPSTSSTAEVETAAITLRDRMRELVRNNPWASKAINVIVSNTIGTGIMMSAKSKNARGNEAAMRLWRSWAETTDCDASRRHNLYGIQNLAMRTVVESGEALIIRETTTSNTSIPFCLRVCEPDHLDRARDGQVNGGTNRIRQGIEYNEAGIVVAYWIFKEHPGDRLVSFKDSLISVRVPADRVIHVYKEERPGQIRGVPWGASTMIRLRELDDYEDAQLLRQKISACYTAFVVDMDGSLTNTDSSITEKIEPGAIEILPPGRDIRFASPPSVAGYNDYVSSVLHSVAAGFGITYESLTGDMSQVNFSSGRMGWIEMNRNIESWRWNLLVPQMLDPVWEWFVNGADLVGQNFATVRPEWTPPRREMIDPKTEIQAIKDSIRSGLMTLSEAQRMFGYDPFKLLTEYSDDLKQLDALGIVLDIDARKVNDKGSNQSTTPAPTTGANEATDIALRSLAEALSNG